MLTRADRAGESVSRERSTIRVLFAIGSLEPGGSETQLSELVIRVRDYQVDPALVMMEIPTDLRRLEMVKAAGIQPVVIGVTGHRLRDPGRLAVAYARLLSEVRPDVVYAWLEETAMFLVPLARMRRIPVVVARRNISGSQIERKRYIRAAVRRAEAAAALVTANSQSVLDAAAARGVARDRLRLVPNGHPALDPLPEPDDGPVTLGYVAGFRPEKGHLRLLDALARLPRDERWLVRLAGVGTLQSEVRAKARQMGIGERLEFLGDVRDIRQFWRDTQIAVLLSDHEGSPNALIEAAFAGRPIVATRVGGSAELVTPEMGFLVAPQDADGIARAMRKLLDDPVLRRTMGAAAHDTVMRAHSMDQSVRGHVDALFEAFGTTSH